MGAFVTQSYPFVNNFLELVFPMGDTRPVPEKETRLSVRIDRKLKARLAAASHSTGVDEPSIVRQCLAAFCDHVEMHGRAVFPITIGGNPPPRSAIEGNPLLNEPSRK